MKPNYYHFDEGESDIKEKLSLIDELKTKIDKKKALQKEHWSAIQEKLYLLKKLGIRGADMAGT